MKKIIKEFSVDYDDAMTVYNLVVDLNDALKKYNLSLEIENEEHEGFDIVILSENKD